jgi:hypothetical protein
LLCVRCERTEDVAVSKFSLRQPSRARSTGRSVRYGW